MACATTAAGDGMCWGGNFDTYATTPVLLSFPSVSVVSTGNRPCVISSGAVQCREQSSRQWQTIAGLGSGVQQLLSGAAHTCALTAGGGVKCWGDNTEGQLGDGTTTASGLTPVDVVGLGSGVSSIDVGDFHSCALLSGTGELRCWGNNVRGVLGDGTTTNRPSPVTVAGLGATPIAVAAGGNHTCALISGGTVKCWGRNLNGELGNGATANQSLVPVSVSGLTGAVQLDLGDHHSCARTMAGGLRCWGSNTGGRLGDGTSIQRTTPVDPFTSGITTFSTGSDFTCAINTAGELLCWGTNASNQLGDGTTTSRLTPTYVLGR